MYREGGGEQWLAWVIRTIPVIHRCFSEVILSVGRAWARSSPNGLIAETCEQFPKMMPLAQASRSGMTAGESQRK